MTTDDYHVFEMNVTKEEKATIDEFCRFLDDLMGYIDSFELLYYMMKAIELNEKDVLDGTDFKININVEEGEN